MWRFGEQMPWSPSGSCTSFKNIQNYFKFSINSRFFKHSLQCFANCGSSSKSFASSAIIFSTWELQRLEITIGGSIILGKYCKLQFVTTVSEMNPWLGMDHCHPLAGIVPRQTSPLGTEWRHHQGKFQYRDPPNLSCQTVESLWNRDWKFGSMRDKSLYFQCKKDLLVNVVFAIFL